MRGLLRNILVALTLTSCSITLASPLHSRSNCRKTKVAILGAGLAGITAAVSFVGSMQWTCLTIAAASAVEFLGVGFFDRRV